ncbi:MAG: hypothetical protein WA821_00745 [Anaerolineales bacterium]
MFPAMAAQKVLYMLIGPKGAGKTHIGTLISQRTDILFLRVEPIWMRLRPGENGWKKVEAVVDTMFQIYKKVMIESLGIGAGFQSFHSSLAQKYPIQMIRVCADPDTCLRRAKDRDSADQIAVSDDQIAKYNQIAAGVSYDWDLEIDNNLPISEAEILAAVQSIGAVRRDPEK